mgnify:CR=1 FL=1
MSRKRYPLNKFLELLKNPPPNVDIMLYDKNKKRPRPEDNTMNKPTLSQRMERLETIVIEGFKQVNERIDNIEKRLDYNGLQIERIEKRLDYNNLKPLPNHK